MSTDYLIDEPMTEEEFLELTGWQRYEPSKRRLNHLRGVTNGVHCLWLWDEKATDEEPQLGFSRFGSNYDGAYEIITKLKEAGYNVTNLDEDYDE